MRLLIDVCDVMADVQSSIISSLGLKIDWSNVRSWDIFDSISVEDGVRVRRLFDDPMFWKGLSVVDQSVEAISSLRTQGHDIHWVTSPWYTCDGWYDIRREWLMNNFNADPVHDITFTAQKSWVGGDVLIDDRPKHVTSWQERHPDGRAYLFVTSFNRWFSWSHRCVWGKDGIHLV